MKISDAKLRHQQQAVALRSRAQELKDAAAGEKAAALGAKQDVARHRDTYVVANATAKGLQTEAAKLRADAAEKLKEAVGGRGLHALENVARGFGRLMAKLTGRRRETTITLRNDPLAKAAGERLLALAAQKDAAAQEQLAVATSAHAQATAALAQLEGHEKTAANHLAMAAKLLGEAKGHDRTAMLAGAAQSAGDTVKAFFDEVKKDFNDIGREIARDVRAEAKVAWGDLKGGLVDLLRTGADALVQAAVAFAEASVEERLGRAVPKKNAPAQAQPADDAARVHKDVEAKVADVEKKKRVFYVDSQGVATTELPSARPPAPSSFQPGRVSFGAASAAPVQLPNIDAPLKGDKKASESLVALRWAAEAAGIDWSAMGAGPLKAALASHSGGLHIKNGASPFEVKARLMERLELPAGTGRANVQALDLGVVREEFAKRTAVGLDRLAPRAELERQLRDLGLDGGAASSLIAMTALVRSSQDVAAAKDELKKDLKDAAKLASFQAKAKALDASKKAMLDVIRSSPAGDRRIRALDTVDAVEVAHGKPGATTKLGFAVESLTQGRLAEVFQKALGLDDAAFAAARDAALRASEWTTLGEMTAPSSTLAFPGPLDDAGRSRVATLPAEGTRLAKELGLLDGDALAALEQHLTYKTDTGSGAQLLGLVRMLSSLSQRRDFRTKEQLSADEVHAELMKNAQPPHAKIDARLVSALQPVLADVLKALRV
jgi:hypothetical protein